MKRQSRLSITRTAIALALGSTVLTSAHADAVIDWNEKANQWVSDARLGTPPAVRVLALAQTAVYEAVRAAGARASVDAAVAAANHAVLQQLLPEQRAPIAAAYQTALADIAPGAHKDAGIAVGEQAAAAVLRARADDTGAIAAATAAARYRPHTRAGAYVPTAMPALPHWPQRKPWLMSSAAQFRAAAPPALESEHWAREYNEVKELGARASARRSAEQTEIARFWEYSLPSIYYGVVRSVALQPGRDPAANARLYAAAAQAMDDAMIGVFEAKYHYHFWRPVSAIRNGDIDGNDGTARDASWASLIEAPLHPEYPSAHAILAGSVGAVLKAESGGAPVPRLATSSPTAKGATRQWNSVDAFVQEVADARVYAGIHYRFATQAGITMGQQIGELAAAKFRPGP